MKPKPMEETWEVDDTDDEIRVWAHGEERFMDCFIAPDLPRARLAAQAPAMVRLLVAVRDAIRDEGRDDFGYEIDSLLFEAGLLDRKPLEEWECHVHVTPPVEGVYPLGAAAVCGERFSGFGLVDAAHARGCVEKQTRLQPCPACWAAIQSVHS